MSIGLMLHRRGVTDFVLRAQRPDRRSSMLSLCLPSVYADTVCDIDNGYVVFQRTDTGRS